MRNWNRDSSALWSAIFLNRDRASHGMDGARELDQYTVTGGLDDAPPMGSDCRINDLAPYALSKL
jgi:hypothetical protein